jgi:hypothetical protein
VATKALDAMGVWSQGKTLFSIGEWQKELQHINAEPNPRNAITARLDITLVLFRSTVKAPLSQQLWINAPAITINQLVDNQH